MECEYILYLLIAFVFIIFLVFICNSKEKDPFLNEKIEIVNKPLPLIKEDTILITILLRDNENFIETMCNQFDNLEKSLKNKNTSVVYFIYENDSKDNTVKLVNNWKKNKDNVLLISENNKQSKTCSGSNCSDPSNTSRIEKLSKIRNKVMNNVRELLKSNSYIKYVSFVDSDIFFESIEVEKLLNVLNNNQDISMTTPFSIDLKSRKPIKHYYDISAYVDINGKQYDICNYDCEQCKNVEKRIKSKKSEKNGPTGYPWSFPDNNNKRTKNYIEPVQSAFAGFSIIKRDTLDKLNGDLWGIKTNSNIRRICEHVKFCENIRKHGNVVVVHDSTMYYK